MNPRERIEEREYDVLSPRAFHVKGAKRAHAEAKDPLRTDWGRQLRNARALSARMPSTQTMQ